MLLPERTPDYRTGLPTGWPRSSRRARSIRTPSSASAISDVFAWPLLRPASVLRLARTPQLRIRPMLGQNISARLVEEHAPEAIAETRGGEPRSDPGLVDRVHLGALFDQELDHP